MRNLGLMDPAFLGGLGGDILWTPAEISTALWLDAADSSTITLNGSTVSQWNDKSGRGNHVSNATASFQPTYLTTGWNNKPTLSFTQLGEHFLFNSEMTSFSANNDYTLASAFEFLQATNQFWDMIMGWRQTPNSASFGAPVLGAMSYSDSQIGIHNTDAADVRIKVNVTSRLGKKIATVSRSGGTNGNGGAVTVTSTGSSQVTYSTDQTQTWSSAITSGFQVGGRIQPATSFGDKYISEVVGCNTKLSTADRQKLEGYLAHKWGQTANLPSDHPFKVSPPYV
jgi:hypothetical protein